MKELSGSASADVAVAPERAYAVLADVERYQTWYPDVISTVQVLERGPVGEVMLADVTLSAPGLPISDLEARMRVDRQAEREVALVRVPDGPGDDERFAVRWAISSTGDGTRVGLRLEAVLAVPRVVPVGGVGDRIAGGFLRAAVRKISPD